MADKSAYVEVFGCLQNEADGEALRGVLRGMGYAFTPAAADADLVVLVSCAVREKAEQRLYGRLGSLARGGKPGRVVAVCGCAPQLPAARDTIRRSYPHVNLLFAPGEIASLPALLSALTASGERLFTPIGAQAPPETAAPPPLRAAGPKANVSVMTGCNNACSYCVVPRARGPERSRSPERIEEEVRALVADGYTEIWLLGQNVCSYAFGFPALLRRLAAIDGRFALRFMTSHPKDTGEELFRVMASCEKVAPFLHLPVQSGSDNMLRAMNRGYTREEYLGTVRLARAHVPALNLTSDIIVGFPGESEEDFCATLSLLEEVRFNHLFTFLYSPRSGTPAAALPCGLSAAEKKGRFARLLDAQKRLESA
ncbi:MAG: MiaB/RimO family radical SAM methylthiotransferase [Oscillospiraceae bacterium]|jgi:tRNA-2-methylthio-N6-dimethylallyladenosine synthase|nr:MiaB/RimO family radical SAM methylthiotransferase [Oscillospiraceae bacterium]